LMVERVAIARAHGRSWNQIAVALGVTRQAARQRFAGKLPASPGRHPRHSVSSEIKRSPEREMASGAEPGAKSLPGSGPG
jgi:hypothetical protein